MGLSASQMHTITEWDGNYKLHSNATADIGAWKGWYGNHYVHDGADYPRTGQDGRFGSSGCIELLGPNQFDRLNERIIELSGIPGSDSDHILQQVASKNMLRIKFDEVTIDERPNLWLESQFDQFIAKEFNGEKPPSSIPGLYVNDWQTLPYYLLDKIERSLKEGNAFPLPLTLQGILMVSNCFWDLGVGTGCISDDNPNEPCGPLQPFRDAMEKYWPRKRDPLAIDLDGDGVETISLDQGVWFDYQGDGFAERTGWAHPDDGMLAVDYNYDNIIEDGKELVLDFEQLATYDDNSDGNISSSDSIFAKLRVWQDYNSNGYSDEGELRTLETVGIESISVESTTDKFMDANGNTRVAL